MLLVRQGALSSSYADAQAPALPANFDLELEGVIRRHRVNGQGWALKQHDVQTRHEQMCDQTGDSMNPHNL